MAQARSKLTSRLTVAAFQAIRMSNDGNGRNKLLALRLRVPKRRKDKWATLTLGIAAAAPYSFVLLH